MKFPFRLLNVLARYLIGFGLSLIVAQKLPEMFVWFPATSDAVGAFAGVLFGMWIICCFFDDVYYLVWGNRPIVGLLDKKE